MLLPCDQSNSILMFPDATEKDEKAIIIFLQPQMLASTKGCGLLGCGTLHLTSLKIFKHVSQLQNCQPFRGKSKMNFCVYSPKSRYLLYKSLTEPPMHDALLSAPLAEKNVLQLRHLVWVLSIPLRTQVDLGLGLQGICQSLRGQIH